MKNREKLKKNNKSSTRTFKHRAGRTMLEPRTKLGRNGYTTRPSSKPPKTDGGNTEK